MDNEELVIRLTALIMLCIIAISVGTMAFSGTGSDNSGQYVPDEEILKELKSAGGAIYLSDGRVISVSEPITLFHREWKDGRLVSQKPCGVSYTSLTVQDGMLVVEKHNKYSEEYKPAYSDKTYDITIIPLEHVISYQPNGSTA